jgi:hypothetical protein
MLEIHSITIDCADPCRLALFWGEAAGWQEDPDDPNKPGDPAAVLLTQHGVRLLFLPVPEGKAVKNRVHLDLRPAGRTRDEEVERLLGIGATLVDDHREADGTGWAVLADPEANEFCVERSAAERGAHG